MDFDYTYLFSQVAGAGVLASRVISGYAKMKHPGAPEMRKVEVTGRAANTVSYALLTAWSQTGAAGLATIRGSLLLTSWGAKQKKYIGPLTSAASIAFSTGMAKTSVDYLPALGTTSGMVTDMQAEGRYARLAYLPLPLIWVAIALQRNQPNYAAAAAESCQFATSLYSIYPQDIKDAAGTNRLLSENIKAWAYGIAFHAPTGANYKGQVKCEPGEKDEIIRPRYLHALRAEKNPYFLDQASVLAEWEQREALQPR